MTAPEQFNFLYTEGLKLLQDGKLDEGNAKLYEAAKACPQAWLGLAIKLSEANDNASALLRFNEVLQLTKDHRTLASANTHIGKIVCHEGSAEGAMTFFRKAAKLSPDYPDCWSNMGLIHQFRGEYKEAVHYAAKALAMNPWHEQAQFIAAMSKLLAGDYVAGFKDYECRWRSKNNGLAKIVVDCPEWDGTNGKKLFIYGEQGHGDSILMLRYAPMIRARGIQQFWVAQKGLDSLLATMPEIDKVLTVGEVFTDFDCHLPSVSLPLVFATSLANLSGAPYIPKPRVEKTPGFHVGIAWRGSATQANDKVRSTRLEYWKPVLAVPGVTFHSLQVDNAEEALLWPQIKTSEPPKTFLDTARRMAGMDLIITVDTSILHLAGAMGIPCWCAMHCRPYFVYPPALGDRCPWYDSVRLFRQEKEFEWLPVFERIAAELCSLKQ